MTAKILIADDEPHVLRSLEFVLKKAGFTIVTAENGELALEKALSERPDLILLDIQMPKMDGNTVCRKLRDDESFQSVPIIMLTAKGQEAAKEQSFDSGADEFMTKPYSPRSLVARVQQLLGATDA